MHTAVTEGKNHPLIIFPAEHGAGELVIEGGSYFRIRAVPVWRAACIHGAREPALCAPLLIMSLQAILPVVEISIIPTRVQPPGVNKADFIKSCTPMEVTSNFPLRTDVLCGNVLYCTYVWMLL